MVNFNSFNKLTLRIMLKVIINSIYAFIVTEKYPNALIDEGGSQIQFNFPLQNTENSTLKFDSFQNWTDNND